MAFSTGTKIWLSVLQQLLPVGNAFSKIFNDSVLTAFKTSYGSLRSIFSKTSSRAVKVSGDGMAYLLALQQFLPSGQAWTRQLRISVDFDYVVGVGGSVQFIPRITGVFINSYDWDFGDGSAHSSEVSPVHDYGA
jgi:PKD repeat protein